jgi:hypothetical protein
MIYLVAKMGVPPAYVDYVSSVAALMTATVWMIYYRNLLCLSQMRHMQLSPGEQYRQHLNAGGYRP